MDDRGGGGGEEVNKAMGSSPAADVGGWSLVPLFSPLLSQLKDDNILTAHKQHFSCIPGFIRRSVALYT